MSSDPRLHIPAVTFGVLILLLNICSSIAIGSYGGTAGCSKIIREGHDQRRR